MLLTTKGIVLHAFKYGETSLITEIYTQQAGLRRYVVNGVRTKKARFSANLFQVLTPLELVVYHREDRDLNRLKEARPDWVLQQIPFDFRRGAVALFFGELIRKTIREADRNEDLYAFLHRAVGVLDRSEQVPPILPLYFLVQLSVRLGFQPSGAFTGDTPYFHLEEGVFAHTPSGHKYILEPDQAALLYILLEASWSDIEHIQHPLEIRRLLLDQLILYFQLHLGHFQGLNSPEILKQVMDS